MAYTEEQKRERNRESQRRYRLAHKDEISERRRAFRAANAEMVKENNRKYNDAHKETQNEQMRAWWKKNREHYKEIRRKYYTDNKQALRELNRAGYLANRERLLALSRNSQARAKGAEGSFTAEDVKAIWLRQGMKCAVPGCTHPISDTIGSKYKFHVDHIRPFTRGGSNWPSNLQILCSRHNLQKWNRDENEWAQRHGISLEKRENNEQEIS